MEGDADGPENATETDTLVNNESEISEDALEKAQETSTLLSDMAGQSVGEFDETNSRSAESKSQPHPYHMKNKYTFRSDSVYSDVIPMSASQQSHHRTSEPRDKSGSLSSLKAKESKWTTLKKKLGKLNSHSHSSSAERPPQDEKDKSQTPPVKSLHEKRNLFQRAKTLSVIGHRSSKDKEEQHHQVKVKKVVVQEKPLELFNVGGEMNMIPLEFLIDVNDLNISN